MTFVSAAGQHWRGAVLCPECQQVAVDKDPHKPRFRCGDRRCRFRYGWRLRFGKDLQRQPGDRLFAVPLEPDGKLDARYAVRWIHDVRPMTNQRKQAAA
jgi:hypothetical protein